MVGPFHRGSAPKSFCSGQTLSDRPLWRLPRQVPQSRWQPVILDVGKAAPDGTRKINLPKFKCPACHVQGLTARRPTTCVGLDKLPKFTRQYRITIPGNFKYITDSGNRKGRNISHFSFAGESNSNAYDSLPGLICLDTGVASLPARMIRM